LAHFFGAFVRARSLRVIVLPAIGADEEVTLALRHARRFAAGALAVNSTTNRALTTIRKLPWQRSVISRKIVG